MSKWLAAVTLVLLLPVVGSAQFRQAPPVQRSAGFGIDLPGWWARIDDPRANRAALKLAPEGSAIHATTGPAAIFWDPQQTASGEYTVTAKFTIDRMPKFEEGYGLFIGGKNLDKDDERFTALLIHEDGSYAIRQRRGQPVPDNQIVWSLDPALSRPDKSDHETNELQIRVSMDEVSFVVNGREIARRPAASVDTDGIVGLRIANNLDVHVDGFTIEKGG